MTAGLPGTGIGGLFYLLCALWMPCRELVLTMRGRGNVKRWRAVGRQLGMAVGIIFAMWLIGWLLGLALLKVVSNESLSQPARPGQVINILHVAPFIMSLLTLGSVLLSVRVLRVVLSVMDLKTRPTHRLGRLGYWGAHSDADAVAPVSWRVQGESGPGSAP